MKLANRIGLISSVWVFVVLGLSTFSLAAEYYRYKDPHGNLVISNKPPPPGSTIIKKYELPEPSEEEGAEPDKVEDPRPKLPPESAPQPRKTI